jgi:hypothetical protein
LHVLLPWLKITAAAVGEHSVELEQFDCFFLGAWEEHAVYLVTIRTVNQELLAFKCHF